MIEIQRNKNMALLTSLRVGGPASFYCEPSSPEEIVWALDWAKEKQLAVFVLGRGTNLCLSDQGWPGLVINTGSKLCGISWQDTSADVMSGTLLHELVLAAAQKGFCGIEKLAGIPGTVGGAVIMNAGAFEQSFGAVVENVICIDIQNAHIVSYSKQDLNLHYRNSSLKGRELVVAGVTCRFCKAEQEELLQVVRDILDRRRFKQPLDKPNCGSVFKNPVDASAGRLVEACGLKGFAVGGAQVSLKHANFIVTNGNATAEDFRRVVAHVQQEVYRIQGVLLEPEVLFVGTFAQPLFGSTI